MSHVAVRPLHKHLTIADLARLVHFVTYLERLSFGLVIVMALMIVIQFLYPSGRSLPNQYLGSTRVSNLSSRDLQAFLLAANDQIFTVTAGNRSYQLTPRSAGITVDTGATLSELMDYSWRSRLIPFTLLGKHTAKTQTRTDSAVYSQLSQRLIADNNKPAVDAVVTKQPDKSFFVVPEVHGSQLTPEQVDDAFSVFDPYSTRQLALVPGSIAPAITAGSIQKAIATIETVKREPPVINYNGASYCPSIEDIAEWANIIPSTTTSGAAADYDISAIRTWLSTHLPLLADQSDSNSQGIDLDITAAGVQHALITHTAAVDAGLKTLSPTQKYIRQYNPTSEGIQRLIADWKQDHPSLQAGVVFQEIGGLERHASLSPTTQFKTASVYKLFLAWYLYHQIEIGAINPDSAAVNGKTIAGCIEAMIVVSDNACGETLGYRYGWSTLNSFVAANGISGVRLNVDPPTASPNATAEVLKRLHAGTLLSRAHTDELIGFMRRQVYRSGIPAGSVGSSVADKVGFDASTWNDVANVNGSKITYNLVVYTNSNSTVIKELAWRINSLLQE